MNKKLRQLGSIIKQLNNGLGPDILGVAQIENESVLKQLIDELTELGRNYGIKHHESDDKRGIDVAYIYDKDKFTAGSAFDHGSN